MGRCCDNSERRRHPKTGPVADKAVAIEQATAEIVGTDTGILSLLLQTDGTHDELPAQNHTLTHIGCGSSRQLRSHKKVSSTSTRNASIESSDNVRKLEIPNAPRNVAARDVEGQELVRCGVAALPCSDKSKINIIKTVRTKQKFNHKPLLVEFRPSSTSVCGSEGKASRPAVKRSSRNITVVSSDEDSSADEGTAYAQHGRSAKRGRRSTNNFNSIPIANTQYEHTTVRPSAPTKFNGDVDFESWWIEAEAFLNTYKQEDTKKNPLDLVGDW
jgi:hypothetical protein